MGKSTRRIVNWAEYNQALVKRGSITFWFDEGVCEAWYHKGPQQGRGVNKTYSDVAIQTALMLKVLFNLPLRMLEGFLGSLIGLMGLALKSPDYSTISKRARKLEVAVPRRLPQGQVDVVVDSSGVKVYGEGEWKVRTHGADKRRVWRKLHLAVDPASHEVIAATLTTVSVGDAEVLPGLLEQLPAEVSVGTLYGDGAYDTEGVYQAAEARGRSLSFRRGVPQFPGTRGIPEATPSGLAAAKAAKRGRKPSATTDEASPRPPCTDTSSSSPPPSACAPSKARPLRPMPASPS